MTQGDGQMTDTELRKWCLERAFETRALSGVNHMEVTNVANDYYEWITQGISQQSRAGGPSRMRVGLYGIEADPNDPSRVKAMP